MSGPRLTGSGRIPCLIIAVVGVSFAADLPAAATETVAVQVTFVDPIAISETSALQFGALDQNLANLETVTVAPDNAVTDPSGRVEGGSQAAASLTVTATPGKAITIHVESVAPGAGYSLTDFSCSYDAGPDAACDGGGYSGISVASGALRVGATLTGDGTAVAGAADGSFDVTVTYQ